MHIRSARAYGTHYALAPRRKMFLTNISHKHPGKFSLGLFIVANLMFVYYAIAFA